MQYAFNIPEFLDWVVETWAPAGKQARHIAYSRSHYSSRFTHLVGESPSSLRHRLQMEAAAHLLANSALQVGEIAVEVGYATPEAFAKAFKTAFARTPSEFRVTPAHLWIESNSGIHFHPHGLIVRRQGDQQMQLSQLLAEHHVEETARILDLAAQLSDDQLDQPQDCVQCVIPWDTHELTLRGVLTRLVATDAIWMAALQSEAFPPVEAASSIEELKAIHRVAGEKLLTFFQTTEAENLWESEFVDGLCSPPQRFRFDGVFAHIIEFAAARRAMALGALRALNAADSDYGDALHWQRGLRGPEVSKAMNCL